MSLKDFTSSFVDCIESLPVLPQEVVIEDTDKDWRGLADSLLKNIDDGIKGFEFSLELLQRLEEEKKRVVSPGLPPARRRKLAYEASAVIDALHAQNRVLEFLGQTYAYATLLEIVKTRTLENMEVITRWEKAHDDLIAAHRVAANFTIQWLTYIKDTIQGFKEAGEKGLPFGLAPVDEEAARGSLESLLESNGENGEDEGDMGRFRKPLIDNLLARCDPLSADWPYKLLWKLALHLEIEGRAEEGCAYMQKIAGLLEGSEVERTESAGVLKTWARLLAAPDLCRLPQFEMTRLILSNALRYAPNDEEIQKMWVSLVEQEQQVFGDLKGLAPENAAIKWREKKADVEKLITRGQMFEALHKAWSMVERFHENLPDESRGLAVWCLSTTEKLINVLDGESTELTSFVRRLRENFAIIEGLKVPVTPFMAQKIYPGFELKFLPIKAE